MFILAAVVWKFRFLKDFTVLAANNLVLFKVQETYCLWLIKFLKVWPVPSKDVCSQIFLRYRKIHCCYAFHTCEEFHILHKQIILVRDTWGSR